MTHGVQQTPYALTFNLSGNIGFPAHKNKKSTGGNMYIFVVEETQGVYTHQLEPQISAADLGGLHPNHSKPLDRAEMDGLENWANWAGI